jgi:hypothetical protein
MLASVCVGGVDGRWQLPASQPDDRPSIGGGERTMYELAFALAALGHDVELRGCVSRRAFDELAAVTAPHPRTDGVPRRPLPGEVVLLLEGFVDPLVFASIALSEARPILLVLAPAGLMGWSFDRGWSLPDPLTVDLATIDRPSSYQAMAAIGFELWTNSPGTAASIESAGVRCRWVGNGTPGPLPALVEKPNDIVIVGGHRWEPLAREAVADLDARVLVTEPSSHEALIAQLATARLFVHPMRTEGTSRLGVEARAVGTVPVVLPHPFGAGFDEASGAVVTSDVRASVRALLADPLRVEQLSAAGRTFAEAWLSWPAYLARLDEGLSTPPSDPAAGARAEIGAAIDALLTAPRNEELAPHATVDPLWRRISRRARRRST